MPSSADPLLIDVKTVELLSFHVLESSKIIQEVRVGYLSMCVAFNSGTWSCNTNAQELATFVVAQANGDPLNLLRLAEKVRTGTFFYALM